MEHNNSQSASYAAAGVDITAGYRAVELMKTHIARTRNLGCLDDVGGFGGCFGLNVAGMEEPVLVSGTDGCGTKVKLAILMDKHDTIGIDAVAMCVNDIICVGAKPLFFLDYIACGKNVPEKIAEIVGGVAEGCVQSGAALIGGETAEHPGLMPVEDYDLAGFAVGIVDKKKILDKTKMAEGDTVIALASSGIHSNGFSLIRKVFRIDENPAELYQPCDALGGKTIAETLLTPTKIYVKSVLALLETVDVKGISHITGGGFYENIPRSIPDGLCAKIDKGAVKVLPIFDLIAKTGNIPERDMFNTYNMGVGMSIVVPAAQVQTTLDQFTGADRCSAAERAGRRRDHRRDFLQRGGLRPGAGAESGYPRLCAAPERLRLQPRHDPGASGKTEGAGYRPGGSGGLHGHLHRRAGAGLPQRHYERPPRSDPVLLRAGLLWAACP